MGISADEERELTESKYWRPEIGRQYQVVLQGWRFTRRAFKEDNSRVVPDEERRPTFVADVMQIDGVRCVPPKEFSSANKSLNRLLMAAVRYAESQQRSFVKVAISRSDAKTYTIIDMGIVADGTDRTRKLVQAGVPTDGYNMRDF